jgi:hypothetical protein
MDITGFESGIFCIHRLYRTKLRVTLNYRYLKKIMAFQYMTVYTRIFSVVAGPFVIKETRFRNL